MSLLKTFQSLLTSGMIDKLSSLVGGNSSVIKTGLTSALPSLIKGIISKGSTTSGAGQLLDLIKNNKLSGNMMPNASTLDVGAKLNESIFGSGLKDINFPGLSGEKRSSLLNAATPLLMGSLGKIASDKNLDAAGLSSFLSDEGKNLGALSSSSKVSHNVKSTVTEETSGGGLGFIKWLLPLLLIGGLAWWFMNKDKSTVVEETKTTAVEKNATHDHGVNTHTHSDGTVHSGKSHGDASSSQSTTSTTTTTATTTSASTTAGGSVTSSTSKVAGYSVDGDGNLLKNGVVFLKKGEYSVKDGEYFDASGKSLGFIGKVGKAIGDAGKAVGGAVAGAADKTADFFKGTFGGMFKKKKAGSAVAAYTLSQITFDPTSHKITNFSKNEIQGLAAALKAYPDAKITVNAGGSDKGVSKKRAQVIHDMLVTLGVSDKQIDAKGSEGAESYSIMID